MQTLEQWINAYSPKQLYTNKNHLFSLQLYQFWVKPHVKTTFFGGNLPPPVINAAMRVPSVKRAEVVPQTFQKGWMSVLWEELSWCGTCLLPVYHISIYSTIIYTEYTVENAIANAMAMFTHFCWGWSMFKLGYVTVDPRCLFVFFWEGIPLRSLEAPPSLGQFHHWP